LIKGSYEKLGADKIRVTELPVGYWTEDFKELLEGLLEPGNDKDGKKITPVIKDYDDMSKDTNVDFTVTFAKGKLDELEKNKIDNGCNGVEKLLKLFTTNTTSNMHLFDAEDKLKKYDCVQTIIDDYYETRLKLYQTRKEYLIAALEKELVLLTNKSKYITEVLNGTVDLRRKKHEEVVTMLSEKGYDKLEEHGDYKYLTKMPMDSVTEENVEKLLREQDNKQVELENIKKTTIYEIWMSELETLNSEYLEYKENRQRLMNGIYGEKPKKVVSKGPLNKNVKNSKDMKNMKDMKNNNLVVSE
jgi:DNA topoisomerase-2